MLNSPLGDAEHFFGRAFHPAPTEATEKVQGESTKSKFHLCVLIGLRFRMQEESQFLPLGKNILEVFERINESSQHLQSSTSTKSKRVARTTNDGVG